MLDFIDFHRLNVKYGHLEGDVLVRYGGDEFVIVMPEVGEAEAEAAGRRVRREIRAHDFGFPMSWTSGSDRLRGERETDARSATSRRRPIAGCTGAIRVHGRTRTPPRSRRMSRSGAVCPFRQSDATRRCDAGRLARPSQSSIVSPSVATCESSPSSSRMRRAKASRVSSSPCTRKRSRGAACRIQSRRIG